MNETYLGQIQKFKNRMSGEGGGGGQKRHLSMLQKMLFLVFQFKCFENYFAHQVTYCVLAQFDSHKIL